MTLTLTGIKDDILANLLTETGSEDHWQGNTPERIERIVNLAQQWVYGEIRAAYPSHFDTEEELTSNADGIITLPAAFSMEKSLVKGRINQPGTWEPVDIVTRTNALARRRGSVRERFAIVGNELKPQVKVTGGQVYLLTYTRTVPDLSGASPNSLIPDRFRLLWVLWGTHLAAEQAGNRPLAAKYQEKAYLERDKVAAEATARSMSEDDGIADVMNYMDDEDGSGWPVIM